MTDGEDENRAAGSGPERSRAGDAEETSGTFLVTAADEASAVLSAVGDGRIHPLGVNPGVEPDEVLAATLAAEGPLGVTWRLLDVEERWTPEVEVVEGPPGRNAREAAQPLEAGRLARESIDGGELHVLAVPPERTDAAVEEVLADETTLRVAARLGARRVEVRAEAGVVGVTYLREP